MYLYHIIQNSQTIVMWTRFVVCVHRKHKNFIDNGTHVTRKYPSHINYSSKMSDFLRFYFYLCHVIDDFLLVLKRSTKVSEKSDMAKSRATFCCPGTYKES